jgi:cystathionine beta-lyase
MEQHFKDGVRVLLLCNPHNPVGRVWTREELEQVSSLCEKYNVVILSDEVHADIALFGNKYTPMGTFPQNQNRLIVYTAITKTFNMAGLSSSCIVIPDETLRGKVQGILNGCWMFGPNSFAFPAIKAAYNNGDAWVDKLNLYIEGNARYVSEAFARHMPEAGVTELEGTFLMWLDYRFTGMTSAELSKLMAEKYGLALGKGSNYGSDGEGFMRLNIGCPRATLEKGMAQLIKMYDDMKG